MEKNTKEYRRDILQWGELLLKKLWLIVLAAVLFAAVYVLASYSPTAYTATTEFYIMDDGGSEVYDYGYYMEQWAYTVSEMLYTHSILEPLAEKCGESPELLASMLSLEETDAYSVIRVAVTSTDESQTRAVAAVVARELAPLINTPLEQQILRPLGDGQYNIRTEHSLSAKKAVMLAFVGAVVCALLLLIADIVRFPLMDERDLANFSAPVLVSVPVRGQKEKYRLLCAKLKAADAVGCQVIGVSGAVYDEGTEQTAEGLAAAFAESGARVQCLDLREHSEAGEQLAGRKQELDWLLVKLPPLCRADAMELSGSLNGILLTAECGTSRVRELAQATDDFRYMKTKLLGYVLTKAPKARS